MSGFWFTPSAPRFVGTPRCIRCGAATMLTRIAPFELGYDLRSFECTNCGELGKVKVLHGQLAACAESLEHIPVRLNRSSSPLIRE
jgi:DNA-directed RNA polymerase subunit RPC12/RpoP